MPKATTNVSPTPTDESTRHRERMGSATTTDPTPQAGFSSRRQAAIPTKAASLEQSTNPVTTNSLTSLDSHDSCNNNLTNHITKNNHSDNQIDTYLHRPTYSPGKKCSKNYLSRNGRKKLNNKTKKEVQKKCNRSKYITNLSSKTLTSPQLDVLALGLTFVPNKSGPISNTRLTESLQQFSRSNRIKYFFKNRPPTEPHPFKEKSSWSPPTASSKIEDYLTRIRKDINELHPLKTNTNLTPSQEAALKELQSDQTIVIKSADKGSGIVIEDTQQYVRDGLDHLSDKTIYEEVDMDPTNPLTDAITKFVCTMYQEGIIDSTTKEYLTLETVRTQQSYFLKKIHKTPIAVRPIVSGCGGPTEKISQLIDLHLKPHVPKIKSYLKDSGHLISLIESTPIPKNYTLATIDVKSLYLNIPHQDGMNAVLNRLYGTQKQADEMTIPPNTMEDLLNIVLKQNYFQFADKMFHQIQGTAMGTKMAPSYANIFMAELEERLLANYPIQPFLWKRYIDDILCIWPGPPSELKKFIEYLNKAHPTIKFTFECSTQSVDFLDLTIYKGPRHTAST